MEIGPRALVKNWTRVQNTELLEELYFERREKHEEDFEFDFREWSEMCKATDFEKV